MIPYIDVVTFRVRLPRGTRTQTQKRKRKRRRRSRRRRRRRKTTKKKQFAFVQYRRKAALGRDSMIEPRKNMISFDLR